MQNIFIIPKQTPYLLAVAPHSSSLQPKSPSYPRSVPMDLPILDISYRWDHVTCGFLHLASFKEPNVFKVHPCCSMCHNFISFIFIASLLHFSDFSGDQRPQLHWYTWLPTGLELKFLQIHTLNREWPHSLGPRGREKNPDWLNFGKAYL